MESEHIRAALNNIIGKTKEAWGDLTNNELLEAKGQAQQLVADLESAIGDAKDKAED